MQIREKITYVKSFEEGYVVCGHGENEMAHDEQGYSCCPNSRKDRYDNSRCEKGKTWYYSWQKDAHTIHLPFDATIEEKILLTHQQIETLKEKLGGKIFFSHREFWNDCDFKNKEGLNKADRQKIQNILFGLPEDLAPIEKKYYQGLTEKLPQSIASCYANNIVRLKTIFV